MKRELVKCKGFDVAIEDHGILTLVGTFHGDGWGQGLGYAINAAFLMRFMGVFGVTHLQQVNGRSCWITQDSNGVYKVEPLHKDEGESFDIIKWQQWTKEREAPLSPYEMRTGKRP